MSALLSTSTRGIPVLMLHSVAEERHLAPHQWLQRLATSPSLLEATMDMWRRRQYTTLSLEEFTQYMNRGRRVPRKSLVLTLDDGYVDNWIVLEPMLRHFGFRATVFVSTDFIDPRPVRRTQLVSSACPPPETYKGYLSWEEMRMAESGGSLDFQSHATTHAWYFVSDRIVDFYRPDNALTKPRSRLRFLWLNSNVERKPFSLQDMHDGAVPFGTPVYEFLPSLEARRFFPNAAEGRALIDFVDKNGGASFFDKPDWRSILDKEVAHFRSGNPHTGEYESEADRFSRVKDELVSSRRILSEGLRKHVRYLSFPQGGMDSTTEALARESGYTAWTMPSRLGRRVNRAGRSTDRIYRCGAGFDALGRNGGLSRRLLSHRLVVERYSGNAAARAVLALYAVMNGSRRR